MSIFSDKEGRAVFQNTLVTGCDGMVGSYVDCEFRTNRRSLDVTDLKEVLSVLRQRKPANIVHLAAETDVDRCERDAAQAYMVNSVGAYNVAIGAKEIGAKLVYVSTSAVFDGKKNDPYKEEDTPNPISQYGHSKYLGELAVSGVLSDFIIARVCWVFGGGVSKDQKFVAKILKQLDKPVINVVGGKRGSPTFGKDLVFGIKRLLDENQTGIFHMANDGAPTRTDLVREIVKITGSKAEVKEVDDNFFGPGADRLDNESMASKVSYMRPWQEALRDYIETEWKQGF